jgi:ribosomal protein L35AE/L33A
MWMPPSFTNRRFDFQGRQSRVRSARQGTTGHLLSYRRGKRVPEPEAAMKFLDCLKSEQALTVFRKYGFIVQE